MQRGDSLEKTLILGKIEGRYYLPVTEDEMVGWHHRLNGHEFEQTPGDSGGQGGLACCSPWGCKESNTTEQMNSNICLKICSKVLQARLQQYMNWEIPDVQAGFQRWARDQITDTRWVGEKAWSSRKTFSASLTAVKSLTMWITTDCGKVLKRWKYQTTLPVSWETCMRGKKQQLELGMEPLTTSQLGKEWDKAVYCRPAYLISMQIISCKLPGWMNPKLKGLLMKLDKPKSHGRVKFSKKAKERREGELTYFLCLHRGSFFFILCTLFVWISVVPCEIVTHIRRLYPYFVSVAIILNFFGISTWKQLQTPPPHIYRIFSQVRNQLGCMDFLGGKICKCHLTSSLWKWQHRRSHSLALDGLLECSEQWRRHR